MISRATLLLVSLSMQTLSEDASESARETLRRLLFAAPTSNLAKHDRAVHQEQHENWTRVVAKVKADFSRNLSVKTVPDGQETPEMGEYQEDPVRYHLISDLWGALLDPRRGPPLEPRAKVALETAATSLRAVYPRGAEGIGGAIPDSSAVRGALKSSFNALTSAFSDGAIGFTFQAHRVPIAAAIVFGRDTAVLDRAPRASVSSASASSASHVLVPTSRAARASEINPEEDDESCDAVADRSAAPAGDASTLTHTVAENFVVAPPLTSANLFQVLQERLSSSSSQLLLPQATSLLGTIGARSAFADGDEQEEGVAEPTAPERSRSEFVSAFQKARAIRHFETLIRLDYRKRLVLEYTKGKSKHIYADISIIFEEKLKEFSLTGIAAQQNDAPYCSVCQKQLDNARRGDNARVDHIASGENGCKHEDNLRRVRDFLRCVIERSFLPVFFSLKELHEKFSAAHKFALIKGVTFKKDSPLFFAELSAKLVPTALQEMLAAEKEAYAAAVWVAREFRAKLNTSKPPPMFRHSVDGWTFESSPIDVGNPEDIHVDSVKAEKATIDLSNSIAQGRSMIDALKNGIAQITAATREYSVALLAARPLTEAQRQEELRKGEKERRAAAQRASELLDAPDEEDGVQGDEEYAKIIAQEDGRVIEVADDETGEWLSVGPRKGRNSKR